MRPRSELLPAIALIGILALAALVIIRPIGPTAPPVQPGKLDIQGGDYQSLSYAVSRIFGARVAYTGKGRSDLHVGALPPDMPFELPVPPGTTVVGSLANELPGSAEIVMDSSLAPAVLYPIVQAGLTGQGFVEKEQQPPTLFDPASQDAAGYYASFCRSRDSVTLNVTVSQQPGDPSAIWVYANWNAQVVSCLSTAPNGASGVGMNLMPKLTTPPGSKTEDYGSGGGSQFAANAYEEAGIEYTGTLHDLADYLTPQLEKAGWTMTGSEISQYGAWSTWLVRDAEGHPWAGALIIVASPVSNRATIRLEITRQ